MLKNDNSLIKFSDKIAQTIKGCFNTFSQMLQRLASEMNSEKPKKFLQLIQMHH